ncbi:recombinase family protein, partial [Klebsiella pneumoniae]|uniref:recombinase family protein n=1 Tax=Klebsiella pneumoniae TaxID=573 RepID=UPI00301D4C55
QNDVTLKMPAFEWVHVQLHQQKGMISLSPPTICNSADTLIVTRVDRLARSIKDLQDIVYALNQQGITLKATEQPVDTRTAAGKAFLDMLGVFAEFETNLRRERQLEGIAAAKARGVYQGRKPRIDPVEVRRLYVEEKMGATAISRQLGIGRASVYRVLDRDEQPA